MSYKISLYISELLSNSAVLSICLDGSWTGIGLFYGSESLSVETCRAFAGEVAQLSTRIADHSLSRGLPWRELPSVAGDGESPLLFTPCIRPLTYRSKPVSPKATAKTLCKQNCD